MFFYILTSKLFDLQVSSYDEWSLHVPTSILPISSLLDDRLANPLIGVCSIPLTSGEDRKGLTVLQMSSAGDIFYQPFIPRDKGGKSKIYQDQDNPITSKHSKDQKISDADIAFLKDWVNELVTMHNENDGCYNEWPLNSNSAEAYFGDFVREIMCLGEPHRSCVLCNLATTEDVTAQEDSDEDSVCPLCGIDVKYGMQLKKSQTLNFVCSKEIKPEDQCADLKLVTNANSYQDPLSKCLLHNWFSNTPAPLNLGSTDNIHKENEVSTITSDANVEVEDKNEDEATKETEKGESSQLSDKMLEQEILESGGQSLDLPMKESLELPTLTPAKSSVLIQSSSIPGSSLPSKQVKSLKRKLNQSMGF